jgi:outer membrane protein
MSRTVRPIVRISPRLGALGALCALGLASGTAAAQAPAGGPARTPAPAQTPAQPAQAQPGQAPQAQPGQAPGQAKALTLADAEHLALRQSPELAISQKSVDAADRRVKAARSQRLPRLSVDSNLLLWNEEIAFQIPGPPNPDMPDMPTLIDVVVRGQVTSTTTVTVAQPLTPLIAISDLIEVEEAGRSASEAELQGTRVDVAFRATDGYLVVLLAQAGQQVATQRVAQVEAQLGRARALVEGGVLQPVDVMRLEVALAAAQRELITAELQVRLALGNLILALGLPADAAVDVQDTLPPEPQPPPAAAGEAMASAVEQRADVRALTFRAQQAESGASAAKASLYPVVAAIGTFQHSEGGGSLQAADSLFAGLTLQWNVWDWGHTWQNYKAAEIQAAQVDLAAARMVDVVRLQVAGAASDAQSAYQALAVTRTGLAAAEEAYRIQSDRFSEGVATTTDVIDAEIEVTQARLGYASARYAYFRALASLARATGQMPSAFLSAI